MGSEREKKSKYRDRRSRSRSRDRKEKREKKDKKDKKSKKSDRNDDKPRQIFDKEEQAEFLMQQNQMKRQMIEKELGYSNADNPFGDKNLTEQFVWKKNNRKNSGEEKFQEIENEQERKEKMLKREIDQIREQRQKREQEREMFEEERNRVKKEKEEEQFQMWMEKEQQFQEDQIKIRTLVRMNYGSERPIDTLVKISYVYRGKIPYEERFFPIMTDVEKYLSQQKIENVEEILRESKVQLTKSQESDIGMDQFWECVITIANQIIESHKIVTGDVVKQNILNKEFQEEVQEMYIGKNIQELEELEKEIELSTQGNEFDVMDFEYWENIQTCIKIYKAKVLLKNLYGEYEQNMKGKQLDTDAQKFLDSIQNDTGIQEETENTNNNMGQQLGKEELQILRNKQEQEYLQDIGCYSPEYMTIQDPKSMKIHILTEEEDLEQIEQIRSVIFKKQLDQAIQALEEYVEKEQSGENQFQNQQQKNEEMYMEGLDYYTHQMIEHQKNQKLEEGEEVFSETINVQNSSNITGLKKPQFFNRVRMGYDWNKYNQVHFDQDNPPPKVVQGYKFNIFYPELSDSDSAPQYFVEKCPGNPDFFILRFTAGPPYEDLAFKILSREWDLMDKKGFKCVFSKKILHLYFNFRRTRYRR